MKYAQRIVLRPKLLVPVVIVLSVTLGIGWKLFFSSVNLEKLADDVIAACRSKEYRPSCYDKEIPKLMDHISMEQAFEVTKLVQNKDPQYVYCHVLAHELSFRESAKDPQHWRDVLPRCPLAMCNYGCLHGSLMQRFRSDSLTKEQILQILPDLQSVCEPRKGFAPSQVDQSMCYHAMGHLGMFITKADVKQSIRLCEQVAIKTDGRNYLGTCLEGVFMTIFQSIDPEDKALVQDILPAPERVASFCAAYDGLAYISCRREAYPLFSEQIRIPQGAAAFCSYAVTQEDIANCYGAILNALTVTWLSQEADPMAQITRYCSGLPSSVQGVCFAASATRLLQIDPKRYVSTSVAICTASKNTGQYDYCMRDVVSYAAASFEKGSDSIREYCNSLPGEWSKTCLYQNQ